MAQFPGGNRMLKKRTPVRRKATGNRDMVPGPERVLTWAGEPMKANG
jgi:hypothetical protein